MKLLLMDPFHKGRDVMWTKLTDRKKESTALLMVPQSDVLPFKGNKAEKKRKKITNRRSNNTTKINYTQNLRSSLRDEANVDQLREETSSDIIKSEF